MLSAPWGHDLVLRPKAEVPNVAPACLGRVWCSQGWRSGHLRPGRKFRKDQVLLQGLLETTADGTFLSFCLLTAEFVGLKCSGSGSLLPDPGQCLSNSSKLTQQLVWELKILSGCIPEGGWGALCLGTGNYNSVVGASLEVELVS